jgi:hypothetical protein
MFTTTMCEFRGKDLPAYNSKQYENYLVTIKIILLKIIQSKYENFWNVSFYIISFYSFISPSLFQERGVPVTQSVALVVW